MESELTFLFYHYGKIPKYLEYAIEQVRIFNPSAEIYVITDRIKNTSRITKYNIRQFEMGFFHSKDLEEFKTNYQHISCFNEKFERFVLERWFVTEIIRKQRPDRTYIMLDSDVAVFGNVSDLLSKTTNFPILLSGRNPHFTLIKGEVSEFLDFIRTYYSDRQRISLAREKFKEQGNQLFTLGEMQFLFEYLDLQRGMRIYDVDSSYGFVDGNLHVDQGFVSLQLRRRIRKKVFWRIEDRRALPYFKRGDELVRAFILHFQGPGKRVFKRFNSLDGPPTPLQIWWWNQIFQRRWLANLM
jgi:hypothetical protein